MIVSTMDTLLSDPRIIVMLYVSIRTLVEARRSSHFGRGIWRATTVFPYVIPPRRLIGFKA